MGKVIETICLNGPHKGMNKVELPYTEEQEQKVLKNKQFEVDGTLYAGWCRVCGQPVRQEDSRHITNVDGLGNVLVDIYCRGCLR